MANPNIIADEDRLITAPRNVLVADGTVDVGSAVAQCSGSRGRVDEATLLAQILNTWSLS